MNIKTQKHLKLIIDNTIDGKLKDLEGKQQQLIKGKIQLQNDQKIIKGLLKQYEDQIILLEKKINQYRRNNNANRNIKQTRDTRTRRD
jgi:hypothetical protein|tara:strand:- start:688 stop:951 length:264 start_codon:yes stop_codon:yes gene_type:complete